jgi:uncharacterized protein YcgL (UPF0745 family)
MAQNKLRMGKTMIKPTEERSAMICEIVETHKKMPSEFYGYDGDGEPEHYGIIAPIDRENELSRMSTDEIKQELLDLGEAVERKGFQIVKPSTDELINNHERLYAKFEKNEIIDKLMELTWDVSQDKQGLFYSYESMTIDKLKNHFNEVQKHSSPERSDLISKILKEEKFPKSLEWFEKSGYEINLHVRPIEELQAKFAFSMDSTSKSPANQGKLYVFENSTDLLCHSVLTNKIVGNDKAFTIHNRLSLDGSLHSLEHYLQTHTDIKEIHFCMNGAEKIAEQYDDMGFEVKVKPPNTETFSEDLAEFTSQETTEIPITHNTKR